jgi:hypothetical protein
MSDANLMGRSVVRGLLLIVTAMVVATAAADDLTKCVDRKVSFDGVAPLRYASVTTAADAKAYLRKQYPDSCKSSVETACKDNAYLVTGDVVAIGNSCGSCDYVQYIGKTKVTTGWIAAHELSPISDVTPKASSVRDFGATRIFVTPTRFRFKLTKGHGQPVCEAYLQRLNQTEFISSPYCDRPENATVPGFVPLNRVPMSPPDILKLIGHVFGFMGSRNQDQPTMVPSVDASGRRTLIPAWTLAGISGALDLRVWRYVPAPDIGNDGRARNLIVWHGLGASSADAVCGVDYANDPRGGFVEQRTLVLTPDSSRIDETATEDTFGHPGRGDLGFIHGQQMRYQGFVPIGPSISVFEFRDVYYFDTYFNPDFGDFYGKRRGDPELDDVLGVFVRQDGHTRQVCEYSQQQTAYD